VLDPVWANGSADRKEDVLGSLVRVQSARATEVFRAALRGSSALAARAANLLSDQRVLELLPEISDRLKTEGDAHALIELISCLKKLHSRAGADLVAPFAMVDREPVTGVAFGVLSDLGSVASPVVAAVLKQGCFTCRESAAYVLPATAATAPALRDALGDVNPHVGILAAVALARSGDHSGVELLRTAATGTDRAFRVWSALALYNLGDLRYQGALLKELDTAEASDRFFAAREILREGRPPLRDLVQVMAGKDASVEVRTALFDGLPVGAEAASSLLPLIHDLDPRIRIVAAKKLLGRSAARGEADDALQNAFLAGPPAVQEEVLAGFADGGALTQPERSMVETGLGSPSVAVQAAAIRAMKGWGRDAATRLAPMLDAPDLYVSATAADMLVEISPSDAVPMLAARLQSPKQRLRIICAGYLLRGLEIPQ